MTQAKSLKVPDGLIENIISDCEKIASYEDDPCESAASVGYCIQRSIHEKINIEF
jgi:hypothetical protein